MLDEESLAKDLEGMFSTTDIEEHIKRNRWIVTQPIAHRGLWDKKNPENSMGSFKQSIINGYPFEFDIQFLADGVPVVFHDDNLIRMTGDNIKISSLTYYDLPKYKLKGTDWTIPTLREVLDLNNGKVPMVIEPKNLINSSWYNKVIYNEIVRYPGKFCIITFSPIVLGWFKTNNPNMTRMQAVSDFIGYDEVGFFIRNTIRRLRFLSISNPHCIAYDIKSLPSKFVEKLRENGIPVVGWTVTNTPERKVAITQCDNYIFEGIRP